MAGLPNGSRLRGRKVPAGISAAKQRLCIKRKSENSHAAAFYKGVIKNMEKTTVTRLQRFICDELVSEYRCNECNAEFIDRYEEYGYCPYCGREIVYGKEQEK